MGMSPYRIRNQSSSDGYNFTDENYGDIIARQSLVLSTAVADGLASIGQEFTRNLTFCREGWCSQGSYAMTTAGYVFLNGTKNDYTNNCTWVDYGNYSQKLTSFQEPSQSFRDTHWTEISYVKSRYGYGWGLGSNTITFAIIILLLHALIVIVHVCYVISSGPSHTFVESIDGLLSLALESKPPGIFNTWKTQRSRDSVWTTPTMVRQVRSSGYQAGERLELVVDSSLRKRGMVEKETDLETRYD